MNNDIAGAYPAHFRALTSQTATALEATGYPAIVIAAGSPHRIFLDDMDYPFKTNPHFRRWVPLDDAAHSLLVLCPGERPLLLHYRPDDYWHKPPEAPTGYWVEHFEIRSIAKLEDMANALPAHARGAAFLGEWNEQMAALGLAYPNPENLLNQLHFQRARKTDYELACMEQATRLGVSAHLAAERAYRDGASEYEIHQAYLSACSHTESELPYGNIIAFGANAAVLHYTHLPRTRPSEIAPSFLIDAGATCNGYACDITRSYARLDDEFAELIADMDKAQQALCRQAKPGTSFPELHLQAHAQVAGLLKKFDLINCSADAALETGITRTFLPHGLGHLLGLQVHDVGGFLADPDGATLAPPEGHPFLRLTRTLEPGWVTTIEPGLYFIETLLAKLRDTPQGGSVNWERVDRFRRYGGVRIEDNVLVEDTGSRNLTREEFARQSPN